MQQEITCKVNVYANSITLVFSTEGAIDRINYQKVIWDGMYPRLSVALYREAGVVLTEDSATLHSYDYNSENSYIRIVPSFSSCRGAKTWTEMPELFYSDPTRFKLDLYTV